MFLHLLPLVAVAAASDDCVQDPCFAPKAFDCPMRRLALEYANVTLGPAAGDLGSVFSGLNLSACGDTPPIPMLHPIRAAENPAGAPSQHAPGSETSGVEIVVSPDGSDEQGDGTLGKPFATVHRAQTVARLAGAAGATVSLRAGTYYLGSPLQLTELDSGTTYQSYPGETAVVSGGRMLSGLIWKQKAAAPVTADSVTADSAAATAIAAAGDGPRGSENCAMHVYSDLACTRDPYKTVSNGSVDTCCAICQADPECGGFTVHGSGIQQSCLLSHASGTTVSTPKANITCGTKAPIKPGPPGPSPGPGPHPPSPPGPPPPPSPSTTVVVAALPVGFNLTVASIDELFHSGVRQWPARYPNGDPGIPRDGYCSDGTPIAGAGPDPTGARGLGRNITTLPQNVVIHCQPEGGGPVRTNVGGGSMEPWDTPFNFTVPCSEITDPLGAGYGPYKSSKMYTGGALDRFTPPISYWSSFVPSGLRSVDRAARWSKPSGWRVHAYHPEGWGNWGFSVDDYAEQEMTFLRGGNQEARGGGDAMGDRYFAGMVEELDAANEFHYDRDANELHWAPAPGVAPPSAATELVVPVLPRLIEVIGSSTEKPATNITISGLAMRHSAPTFCCDYPYESVSGGDWSIHRGGMVLVENATDSELVGCVLDSPGGNGVFLSGYSRGLLIHHNEIKNSGDSSVAAVGRTRHMDGRAFTYPYNNTIAYNHLHSWGIWGKQTSAFFAAMTRELIFDHNIVHDGPRAGINQNDGFAGGNQFSYNLVFNTVLDTNDHGNFNSWDRKPWIWLKDSLDQKSVSMIPQRHRINNNFIIRTAFIGPSKNLYCIDHDDGSSMYIDHDNFLVYGGIKFREGLNKVAFRNLMAFPNGPDRRQVPFAAQCQGTNEAYTNNTVISGTGAFYGSCAKYNAGVVAYHVNMDFNRFYSPASNFSDGGCAGMNKGDLTDWKKWQQAGLGQDAHSTLSPATEIGFDAILAAGRKLVFPQK